MNQTVLAMGVALSLLASAPLHAAGSTDLQAVTADSGHPVLKVGCGGAMWPTQRQVARLARTGDANAAVLRQQIVAAGRATCARGFTHALVEFKGVPGDVAIAPAKDCEPPAG